MARLPRLTVPGYPHHIIQRGNNRQAIFSATADYELLLALIDEHARKQHVAIHGYVLMSNHFHLLATPETAEGIPQMMQAIGRRYVRNYNLRHQRTGTLWEFYHPTLGDRTLLRRKPSAQNAPWRDYVGHNPLFAMVEVWRQSGGQSAAGR